ncbi:MAG: ATP-dependent sacrificial sulfur transferase LarE [Candidatus Bathyarchaeota archaeon]|nr:ATP-dependent sacrificial sulfur transferase LarE [Candidatus Bathyarchaeota archaeon]
MDSLDVKYEKLKELIKEKGKNGVVVAFSGGVDSSTLAAVAYAVLGEKVVAVTAKSPTYPREEVEAAEEVAKEIGIKWYTIETNELTNTKFTKNPENRCYYCKKELLTKLVETAHTLGFEAVFEGTNFSDLSDHRPGFKAVKEAANVYSPWVESGFTKQEIRSVAKKLGLSVENKPPLACLASRIPYHQKITEEKLRRVEKAEQTIKEIAKIRQLRVRDHNGLARIEVAKDEMDNVLDMNILDEISVRLKMIGFRYVALDAEGYRSGSLLKSKNTITSSK